MIEYLRPQLAAVKATHEFNTKMDELASLLRQDFSDHIDVSSLDTPQGIIEGAILMLEQFSLQL